MIKLNTQQTIPLAKTFLNHKIYCSYGLLFSSIIFIVISTSCISNKPPAPTRHSQKELPIPRQKQLKALPEWKIPVKRLREAEAKKLDSLEKALRSDNANAKFSEFEIRLKEEKALQQFEDMVVRDYHDKYDQEQELRARELALLSAERVRTKIMAQETMFPENQSILVDESFFSPQKISTPPLLRTPIYAKSAFSMATNTPQKAWKKTPMGSLTGAIVLPPRNQSETLKNAMITLTPTLVKTSKKRLLNYSIIINDSGFTPDHLVIGPGDTVIFEHNGNEPHHLISQSGLNHFDFKKQKQGAVPRYRFKHLGIVEVQCHVHNRHCVIKISRGQWYALSDDNGQFSIPDIPAGEYRVDTWKEHRKTSQVITIAPYSLTSIVINLPPLHRGNMR